VIYEASIFKTFSTKGIKNMQSSAYYGFLQNAELIIPKVINKNLVSISVPREIKGSSTLSVK
jgi:hypothetical protein